MENGGHDGRGNMSSSLSSSFLHMNPAGAPLPTMKVIISSSTTHGLPNHTGGLSNLNGSFSNPSKLPANPSEDLTKGLSNPHGVTEFLAPPQSGLANNASEDVRVPPSPELKAKKPAIYRECLKNHAAHMGVHAIDGCGEFIPGGAEGTLEALTCAACHCHRNFHRRETEGDELASCSDCSLHGSFMGRRWMDVRACAFPAPLPLSAPTLHSGHMIRGVNMDAEDCGGCVLMSPRSPATPKKRFRTKFTEEQKERMAMFAEALGWRIQKQDEEVVEQFCNEVGVKRHIFKVWMHNNKFTVGKKVPSLTLAPQKAEV